MKLALVFALTLFAAALGASNVLADDIADKAIEVWQLVKDAERAEILSDINGAYHKYKAAIKLLNEIKAADPEWNPHLIEFRLKDCAERCAALEKKGAKPDAPPQTETPPPPVQPQAGKKSTLELLREELEKARAAQAELENKLLIAQAMAKAPPLPESKRVALLEKEKQGLENQLREAHRTITELQKKSELKATTLARLESLKDELDKTRKSLEEARRENARRESELEKLVAAQQRAQKESEARQAALASEKATLEKKLQTANAHIKTLEELTVSATSQSDIRQLRAELGKALAEKSALEQKLAQAEQAARQSSAKLETKLRADAAEKAALESRLKTAEAAAAEASARLAVLTKEKKDLESRLAETQQALAIADRKLQKQTDAEAKLATVMREKAETEARLFETEKQLWQVKSLAAEHQSFLDELARLKNQLSAAQKQSAQYKSSLEKVTAQLNEARQQLDKSVSAPRNAGRIESTRAVILRKENETLRALAEKQKGKVEELERRMRQLEQALAQRDAQLRELTVRKQAASDQPGGASQQATARGEPTRLETSLQPQFVDRQPARHSSVTKQQTADQAVAPKPARTLLEQAAGLSSKNDWDGAATLYERILQSDPADTEALAGLGVARLQQNRLEEAEQILRRCAHLVLDDSFVHRMLGVTLCIRGSYDDALAALSRAIALDPKNPESYNYRGVTLSRKGWQQAAEADLRKAIELKDDYPEAHHNLAEVYLRQKPAAPRLASLHYRKAISLGAQPNPELEKLLEEKLAATRTDGTALPPAPDLQKTPSPQLQPTQQESNPQK